MEKKKRRNRGDGDQDHFVSKEKSKKIERYCSFLNVMKTQHSRLKTRGGESSEAVTLGYLT